MTLEELAREAGAMQLGEAHWIFSREDLERLLELVRAEMPAREVPPHAREVPPLPY